MKARVKTVSLGQAMRLAFPVAYRDFVDGRLSKEPRITVTHRRDEQKHIVLVLETNAPALNLQWWVENLKADAQGRNALDNCPTCGEPLDTTHQPLFSLPGDTIESLCHCCKCDEDYVVIYTPAKVVRVSESTRFEQEDDQND